jgi:hypothetical protein
MMEQIRHSLEQGIYNEAKQEFFAAYYGKVKL